MAVEHHVNLERPLVGFEGMRVSWGGVWAGVLVALGTLLVLSTLGVAIGFTADARNVDPQKISAGAVIWSRAALLIALFLGGVIATRMSMVWDRFTGLAQGALVWVMSLVVVTLLSANGIGLVAGASLIYGTQHSQSGPTTAAWLTFFSTVLSLVAALIGSAVGQRRAAARVRNEIEANSPRP
jgi:hypothetical protein